MIGKVFNGDKNPLIKIIKDLIVWLLEKINFDYSKDQII